MKRLSKLLAADRGATSIEYAAIASLISIVAISSIGAIGTTVAGLISSVPSF